VTKLQRRETVSQQTRSGGGDKTHIIKGHVAGEASVLDAHRAGEAEPCRNVVDTYRLAAHRTVVDLVRLRAPQAQ
jgi:riboflavin synthase alpha subunit